MTVLNDFRLQLGEDEYFLLGDNPPNSRDSRHYGPIKRSAIVGGVQPREDASSDPR